MTSRLGRPVLAVAATLAVVMLAPVIALATGIFNSGTNIGAIIAPLVVPWIAIHLGWRWAFVLTGAIGFVWVNSSGTTSTSGSRPASRKPAIVACDSA